ncbi:competence/damage-inducible protein A [Chloracidobacterium validum]|uniref:CinA-like protein n=1 Tax=Chloracidobacterium validum TaxID=2821543 RepID=A0ABX8B8Z7_9BACT|nr:competence/damage-inducible protein A [Chloracidobacterium validum]QUW02030.1 competence/damage-inducible protein A [Chloracidobacterium validum]
MPHAEIIAIGSELLTPFRSDTNSLWLTAELNALGIAVRRKTVVGDDEPFLEETLRDALRNSPIVITTGGLGPTEDDITRKVVARVMQRPLVLQPDILDRIRHQFEIRGLPMSPNNERQALVPRDATPLSNDYGTAPGLILREGDRQLIVLPGPPREMRPMFTQQVRLHLEPLAGHVRLRTRTLRVAGMGESQVDSLIAPIYTRYTNPTTTILFNNTEVELHFTAKAPSDDEADTLLDELVGQVEDVLGANVFSHRGETLEQIVGLRLTVKGYTIATAESCTGGLVAKRLTDVPGSSQYFLEGVVAYSNAAKTRLLDVPAELISEHGAVSAEVAEAMAAGVKARAGTTIGVGITGIAGPDGGTDEKPVGLVYVGIAGDFVVTHRKFILPGDRDRIRHLASQVALDLVRRTFLL